MELREERLQWKHDAPMIDQQVDRTIQYMKEGDAHPAAYMLVDMAFRPYAHWVHSAQVTDVDPEMARNATVFLVNHMIMELVKRIISPDSSRAQWVSDVLVDLTNELARDLQNLEQSDKKRPM